LTLSPADICLDKVANGIAVRVNQFSDIRRNQSLEKKSWEQQRRRPALLSRRSHATVQFKRCASLKMSKMFTILSAEQQKKLSGLELTQGALTSDAK
jgi:hypothetical protein